MSKTVEQKSIVAQAYEATAGEGDVKSFGEVAGTLRVELEARAADVIKTGLTQNAFEEKVAELHAKEIADAPTTPLGTTTVKTNAVAEAQADGKDAKAKKHAADVKVAKEKAEAEKADADAKAKAAEKAKAEADKKAAEDKAADKKFQ